MILISICVFSIFNFLQSRSFSFFIYSIQQAKSRSEISPRNRCVRVILMEMGMVRRGKKRIVALGRVKDWRVYSMTGKHCNI